MFLHEVPYYHDSLYISVMERIVMAIFSMTMNNLLALVTPTPHTAHPPMNTIHVGGVGLGLCVTVHRLHHLHQVVHLDMIVKPITGCDCVVRAWAQVARSVRGVWDGVVIEPMHVYDIEWCGWQGVEPTERRATDRPNTSQLARECLQGPGPDKHPTIRCS